MDMNEAANPRFSMEQKDIVRVLLTKVGIFIQDRLINNDQRTQQKNHCAERLAAEGAAGGGDSDVRYSDQAVLANLDWGIDALEEAINTTNTETKLARLDYSEKMLQICAMLDSGQKTAGVPNFYLSAWAHLNLAYLWKLRNEVYNSVLHVLEMFIVDPFFSRIDFAPELWRELFLPHMSSIVGWYSEARHRLVMEVIPDTSDMSFTADMDRFFEESVVFAVRPDQMEKVQKLEETYRKSLDENTRIFARFYRDCMDGDSGATVKKVVPMMPIADPPMTPSHEVSRSIPDYVKFGPILPKSAGFSTINRSERVTKATSNPSSPAGQNKSLPRSPRDGYYAKPEPEPASTTEEESPTPEFHPYKAKLGALTSKTTTSSSGSPKTPSPKVLSPKPDPHRRREPISILRLSSARALDSTVSNTLPLPPRMSYRKTNDVRSTNENDEEDTSCISYADSDNQTSRSKPPKDFVCPITGQIFSDPVTLETGQTYERKAIQEWIERGNTSCPITRQSLAANSLPKTNYVLKRLITSWKEQHPDIAREFSYSDSPRNSSIPPLVARTPTNIRSLRAEEFVSQRSNRFSQSPTSVISQAAAESIINGLKQFVSCLCTSDKIQECEAAVMSIAQILKDGNSNPSVCSFLSKPTIVNGLVEILAVSLDREVLRMSIFILSELISADVSIADTLTSLESDVNCLAELFKNGLVEAVVLIHQLRPSFARLSENDLIPSLTRLIASTTQEPGDNLKLFIEPKDAAISVLEQILVGGDEHIRYRSARAVISGGAIPSLIQCMDKVETRLSIILILMCCIESDKGCRVVIAKRIEPCLVLDLFHGGDDNVRGICVDFLLEMVYLEKRTICNKILEMVKEEGALSTMHTFLVYLQMAPMEQQPAIAALLLQLDLLTEPRKMSMYREEAIEALIEALQRKEFPNYQIMALDALLHLSGRFTSSGKLYTEAWLLKAAGFNEPYKNLMNAENNLTEETTEEEEKALVSWETRVTSVLCNHEKGSIFKALEECLKNNSIEIAKSCLVVATWLIHMLSVLPDTGARKSAQNYLLDDFRNIVQSSKNMEEKILAALTIKTFIADSAALELLGPYAKCIYKNVKKLKKHSVIISDILKALMNLISVNAAELWSYTEVIELDSSANSEVLSLLHLQNHLLSSHSDGTIKMWDTRKKNMRLIQEVQEHTKAVTCLCISSGDQIYSGSLDKTIRVWTIKNEELQCIQVHEVKEPVYELCVNNKVACFVSQGTGVKVYHWSGSPKHANFNKTVKSIAMVGNKLYCGCSGYIIQEVDMEKSTWYPFYSGTRKLLGKQTIYALQIHHTSLFAGGSSVDGSAGKVFSLPNKTVVGSFTTALDIQHIAVNSDFIFTATKCGIIEVWLRERVVRVGSIRTNCTGHSKITSLATDKEGGLLFAASSEGKIQVWAIE